MSSGIKYFIRQFTGRGGLYVVLSSFSTKIISVLVAVLVARILSVQEFGAVSFAVMVISPLLPLSGLGMDLVLLRYGAISTDRNHIDLMYNQCFFIGAFFNLLIISVLYLLSERITPDSLEASAYLKVIVFLLFSDFILRLRQNYVRVIGDNIRFSYSGLIRSFIFLILSTVGTYFFYGTGYSVAFVVAPLVASCYLASSTPKMIFFNSIKTLKLKIVKEYLKYGLFIGIGAVVSQLTIPLGGIMLSYNNFDSVAIGLYRVASLIPFSILFLPDLFFKSEFVHLAKHFNDKKVIKDYIINYLKIALPLCFTLILTSYFLSRNIIVGLFGTKYLESANLFFIFILGVSGAFILRQPFGSLSSASGKASLNVISALTSLVFCLGTLVYLIEFYGLYGCVIAISTTFWFSGFLNLLFYYFFIYRRLLKI